MSISENHKLIDCLIDCIKIFRYVSLANNKKLVPIPSDIFRSSTNLRILDLSQLTWRSLNPDQVRPKCKRKKPNIYKIAGAKPSSLSFDFKPKYENIKIIWLHNYKIMTFIFSHVVLI